MTESKNVIQSDSDADNRLEKYWMRSIGIIIFSFAGLFALTLFFIPLVPVELDQQIYLTIIIGGLTIMVLFAIAIMQGSHVARKMFTGILLVVSVISIINAIYFQSYWQIVGILFITAGFGVLNFGPPNEKRIKIGNSVLVLCFATWFILLIVFREGDNPLSNSYKQQYKEIPHQILDSRSIDFPYHAKLPSDRWKLFLPFSVNKGINSPPDFTDRWVVDPQKDIHITFAVNPGGKGYISIDRCLEQLVARHTNNLQCSKHEDLIHIIAPPPPAGKTISGKCIDPKAKREFDYFFVCILKNKNTLGVTGWSSPEHSQELVQNLNYVISNLQY